MRPDALKVLNFKEELIIPSGSTVWETHGRRGTCGQQMLWTVSRLPHGAALSLAAGAEHTASGPSQTAHVLASLGLAFKKAASSLSSWLLWPELTAGTQSFPSQARNALNMVLPPHRSCMSESAECCAGPFLVVALKGHTVASSAYTWV